MFRKFVLLLAAICLLLCGCAGKQPAAENADPLAAITLGMTPEQFLAEMEKANIEISMPDYAEYPIPEDVLDGKKDGRIYNYADYSFFYEAKDHDIHFTFTDTGTLEIIVCHDPAFATREGLKVGDSRQTVETLYTVPADDGIDDQYKTQNGYMKVFYENDTVTAWLWSEYSEYHHN